MIGIGCVVEILKVATDAGSGSSRKHASDMTLQAVQPGMRAHQSEACEMRMIESSDPAIGTMACLTSSRDTGALMIGIFGGTEIADVARSAIGTEPAKQAYGSAGMTAFALDRCMGSPKRKPILVSIRCLFDLQPSSNTVALFAVAPQLASMDIRMTLGTLRPDIRKHQIHVTFFTA
jgi:hypothetical protein